MTTPVHIIRRATGAWLTAALAGISMVATAQTVEPTPRSTSTSISTPTSTLSPAQAASLCAASPVMTTTLRGTYQLEGEGPLPIELVLAPRDGASSRVFQVSGIVSEGEHRFGVSGMAYCTGDAGDAGRGKPSTLAFDITMSGGFHDTPVDDELRRAWPAGKAPKRASSVGTSVVHAEVALASMQGWAEAMRTIVLTGQRVMGPRHVSAKVSFANAGETGHGQ